MTAPDAGPAGVVVAAGGAGERLGPGLPKAFRPAAGEPLLIHALRGLRGCTEVGPIVVAVPAGLVGPARDLVGGTGAVVVAGGPDRRTSVAHGLAALPGNVELVLVHDAARCCAPPELVTRVVGALRAGADAVVPVLPLADTVKEVVGDRVVATPDRQTLRRVQTPQGFRRAVLEAAHRVAPGRHSDDAGLAEAAGFTVHAVAGSEAAFKVTGPLDLLLAEAVLRAG